MTRIRNTTATTVFYGAVFTLVVSTGLAAQQDTAIVEYDHRANVLRALVPHGEKTDTLKPVTLKGGGRAFRFEAPMAVGVRVINTNTGVYKIAATSDSTRAPAVDSLRAFLGRLAPYLPDVALAFAGPMRRGSGGVFANVTTSRVAVSDAKDAAQQVVDALARLDSAMFAPDGVHGVLGKTLRVVERMRTEDVQRQASLLRDSLGLPAPVKKCPSGAGMRQGPPLARRILEAFADLEPGSVKLRRSLVDSTIFDENTSTIAFYRQLQRLAPRADTAQRDYDDVVGLAYRTERLAMTVASACSDWRSNSLPVSLAAGPTITLKIDPRADLELARAADQGSTSITVTLLPPSSRFEPAIGVGFVYAPQARFATYGTRSAPGGVTEIYEQSKKDLRFGYAASLGFTYRPESWRESRAGVSIWLPELTLGQLGDSKSFGVGSAIAVFNRVKLGAGAIWIRHTELDQQHVGQQIFNANFLQTVDTYGKAKPYISLSVFDWPPFLSK
jgi:hypothetical protein